MYNYYICFTFFFFFFVICLCRLIILVDQVYSKSNSLADLLPTQGLSTVGKATTQTQFLVGLLEYVLHNAYALNNASVQAKHTSLDRSKLYEVHDLDSV